jgi:2-polyprenyl-6-methoxyphenol hydroxylase-like FAD-dependent oxidoreductase
MDTFDGELMLPFFLISEWVNGIRMPVVVIGGGTAGCATALSLYKTAPSTSCLVVDDADPSAFKVTHHNVVCSLGDSCYQFNLSFVDRRITAPRIRQTSAIPTPFIAW